MKINSLLESQTPSSSTINTTSSAPEFGRDDEHLEETTTSGSVATVASPVGGTQRRGKGSMFAGIKTSAKFPNSEAVKEEQINEVDPRNFDSDEDYYRARNAPAKARSHARQSPGVNQDDEAYFREIFRKKRLAAQQAERSADHDRLATGTNEGEEMGTFAALKDWQVWDVTVMNNYYRGKYADYGARYYSVVASSAEEARQVVLNNPDYVLQDLLSRKLQSGKRVLPRGSALPIEEKRVGDAKPGTISTMGLKKMLTPDGVQSFKFTNGKIVDGSHMAGGEEVNEKSKSQAQFRTMAAVAHNPEFAKKVGISQEVGKEFHGADRKQDYKDLPKEVDEASFDYTMKDLGNDYAGFASNHSLKHKFLARIKPEKQQLYKDKMNNMHEFDQLFRLFTVAKQRGDIIEQGVEEARASTASFRQGNAQRAEVNAMSPEEQKAHEDKRAEQQRKRDDARMERERQRNAAKKGVAEEKKKGADGKACWDGYRFNGTEDGKDSCVKVSEAEFTEDKLASDLYRDLQIFKKGVDKDIGSKAKDRDIGNKPADKDIVAKEGFNGEYDDEAGSAESNLLTTARAVKGLLDTIEDKDNLPEWVQEKIAKAEGMLVTSWDYLLSQKEQGHDPQVDEDWQKTNKQDKTDGMSPKAVKAYRRENPGSKLKTAVTKKPSELKAGSKDAKRRKSFCARMSGNKGPMKDEKGRPTPKAKALRRWNCEE